MNDTSIHTAINAADLFMQDNEDRLAYLNRELAIMDYESDKAVWTEEGRTTGQVEGEQNIVRKMIKKGYDDTAINDATDWSIEAIQNERRLLSI